MVQRTVLVRVDVLPGDGILLAYLVRQVCLSLLQHVELCPQSEDGILGGVVGPLGPSPSKPSPDARHGLSLSYPNYRGEARVLRIRSGGTREGEVCSRLESRVVGDQPRDDDGRASFGRKIKTDNGGVKQTGTT